MLSAPLKNPTFRASQLIKEFEGCSLTPYRCPAGRWTIGYGSTHLIDDSPVTKETPAITQEEADDLLLAEISHLKMALWRLITVKTTPSQDAALLSLAYNIGVGAFSRSTLLKKLNAGDVAGAADQFLVWNKSGKTVLPGLVRRRAEERRVFFGG